MKAGAKDIDDFQKRFSVKEEPEFVGWSHSGHSIYFNFLSGLWFVFYLI